MPSSNAVARIRFARCAFALALLGGCAREPGEPEPPPLAWNADDHAKGRCVDSCMPDYGPALLEPDDCARAEAGLEFFPVPVWDFETLNADMQAMAALSYAYQDGTTEFLATMAETCTVERHALEGPAPPGSILAPNASTQLCLARYQPTTALAERCGPTHALHVRGGPFREWGGGIGRRLDYLARDAAMASGSSCLSPPPPEPAPGTPPFCPEAEPRIDQAPGAGFSEITLNTENYYRMLVDLREWEGISFWARRGPDGQSGIRVVLGDRNTDDDVSFHETRGGLEPRCRRNRECDCRNHRPCTFSPPMPGLPLGGYFCWDPALDESPIAQMHPWNHELPTCGDTRCDIPYSAYPSDVDVAFNLVGGATCAPHTYVNDITRDECYDPVSGPRPPESTEKCGDPWIAPVRLDTDWTFYTIPFRELRQEGYGKEHAAIDLAGISMVRFTWTVGWIDYWLDDVRFYRRAR